MYELAKSPEKQRILQKELDRVFPDPRDPVTSSKLEELKYLRACIKEAMRISPIIIGNQRMAVKDLVVCGYQIPKGVSVVPVLCGNIAALKVSSHPCPACRIACRRTCCACTPRW